MTRELINGGGVFYSEKYRFVVLRTKGGKWEVQAQRDEGTPLFSTTKDDIVSAVKWIYSQIEPPDCADLVKQFKLNPEDGSKLHEGDGQYTEDQVEELCRYGNSLKALVETCPITFGKYWKIMVVEVLNMPYLPEYKRRYIQMILDKKEGLDNHD